MRHDLSSKHEQHNEQEIQKKPYRSLQGKAHIRGSPEGVDPYRACPAVDLHPNQITQWKNQLLERATEVFAKSSKPDDPPIDVKTLHAKVGQLTLENDFLKGAFTKAGMLSAKR